MKLRALVADDEPLLRQSLIAELNVQMPDIEVVAEVGNGQEAINWLDQNHVDICFLDIRMPGLTGLEVAAELLERRSANPNDSQREKSTPLLVFVTAYHNYAVQAFEANAVDYLLKPVTSDRLTQTLARLQQRLGKQNDLNYQEELEEKLKKTLSKLSELAQDKNTLHTIKASVGDQVRVISIADVVLLNAEDKYVVVHTRENQALIRESLKDLLPQLPSKTFVQIHRSSIVNMNYVESAKRSATGKLTLKLQGLDIEPVVSRTHRHHFKAM